MQTFIEQLCPSVDAGKEAIILLEVWRACTGTAMMAVHNEACSVSMVAWARFERKRKEDAMVHRVMEAHSTSPPGEIQQEPLKQAKLDNPLRLTRDKGFEGQPNARAAEDTACPV